jgi:hypothetical protein
MEVVLNASISKQSEAN